MINAAGSTVQWTRQLTSGDGDYPAYSLVVAGDGTLFLGSTGGTIFAVHANGSIYWSFETGGEVKHMALTEGGILISGSQDSFLYAHYPNSTLKWKASVGVNILSLTTDSTNVYAFGGDSRVHARTLASGTSVWNSTDSTTDTRDLPLAVGTNGDVLLAENRIWPFEADTGDQRWTTDQSSGTFTYPAVLASGTIVSASTANSDIFCIDPDTGENSGVQYAQADFYQSGRIDDESEWMYWLDEHGTLYAVDTLCTSISALTNLSTRGGGYSVLSGDKILYIGSQRRLSAFNVSANSTLWSIKVDGVVSTNVAMGKDGTLYFATKNGTLSALGGGGGCAAGTGLNDTTFPQSCSQCAAGTWSNVFTASSSSSSSDGYCTSCAAGRYSSALGAASNDTCIACSAGTASSAVGASSNTTCVPCSAGTFADVAGSANCTECLMGTFSNVSGSTECNVCPNNTFSATTGATNCTACPTDYCSDASASSCRPCQCIPTAAPTASPTWIPSQIPTASPTPPPTTAAPSMSPSMDFVRFSSARNISTTVSGAKAVFAIDLDLDGDVDALSASAYDDTIAWYENDGQASFVHHTLSTTVSYAADVFAIDLDLDGDVDVLSAAFVGDEISWFENDGNQSFSRRSVATDLGSVDSVYAVDVDGDGDVDVLEASDSLGTIAWFENDGGQNFTQHDIATDATNARTVRAADVDGDDDVDVLSASLGDDTIAWYENDGFESFTKHVITSSADGAEGVAAADVDGDGDVDIVSTAAVDNTVAWFENDGSESFAEHVISANATDAVGVVVADLDGDGDVDVLSAWNDANTVAWFENNRAVDDSSERFTEHIISTSAVGAFSVFAADVDGDGDMDALSAADGDATVAWYEAEGVNTFAPSVLPSVSPTVSLIPSPAPSPAPTAAPTLFSWVEHSVATTPTSGGTILTTDTRRVMVRDIDGDGDMDIAAAFRDGDQIAWYENTNGSGTSFTPHALSETSYGDSVFVTDMDGDGDADIVGGGEYMGIRWYENNGSKAFMEHIIVSTDDCTSLLAVDLDQDGDVDIVNADLSADRLSWYENNGSQAFTTTHIITVAMNNPNMVSVGDIDGDGDHDLAVTASGTADSVSWFENNGSQVFTRQSIMTVAGAASGRIADINDDGALDILAVGYDEDLVYWFENDAPAFKNHTVGSVENAAGVFAADVDNDGDMDLVVCAATSAGSGKVVWLEQEDGSGGNHFTTHSVDAVVPWAVSIFVEDMDLDGRDDVVLVYGAANSDLAWYENVFAGTLAPTLAPSPVPTASMQPSTTAPSAAPTSAPETWDFWVQKDKLTAQGGYFGASVAIRGGVTVVGAIRAAVGGSAYTFTRSGGQWALEANLTVSDVKSGDSIGSAVAIDDGVILVGATSDDDAGSGAGAVYVFSQQPNGDWTQQQKLTASDGAQYDEFGTCISMSGTLAVVGAPWKSDGAVYTGAAYVFTQRGNGVWNQTTKFVAPNASGETVFGISVGIDGDVVIVGSQSDEYGTNSGSAYIFTLAKGNWTLSQHLFASDAAAYDRFGNSVAVSGAVVVVGADNDDNEQGSAYVFERNSNNTWVQSQRLTASDATSAGDANFGRAVAVSGHIVLVGAANGVDADGSESGSAYVFSRRGGGLNWTETSKLAAADAAPGDNFGNAVAVDGSVAVIGAGWADSTGGSAYIFAGTNSTASPTLVPSLSPTVSPLPSTAPTQLPSSAPTARPTVSPAPTSSPTNSPAPTADFVRFSSASVIASAVNGAWSVFATDLNQDGSMDALVSASSADTVVWLENNGSASFTQHIVATGIDKTKSAVAVDLDGDGDVDVVSAAQDGNAVYWHENDGSHENFTTHNVSDDAPGAYEVVAVDLDVDGDVDIVSANSANSGSDTVRWYENDGAQRFTAHAVSDGGGGGYSVFVVDLDNDEDLDVLSAKYNQDTVSWYENNGSQSFTTHDITTSADGAHAVIALDLDVDGDVDVVVASQVAGTVAWYENDGNENFTQRVIGTLSSAFDVYAADFDADGDWDVLSATPNHAVEWYANDGTQSFTSHRLSAPGDAQQRSAVAADLDGDGDMDFFSAADNTDKVYWFRSDGVNTWAPTLFPTTIPTTAPSYAVPYAVHTVSTAADGIQDLSFADIDGDGDGDFAAALRSGSQIVWYETTNATEFSDYTTHVVQSFLSKPYAVDAIDMDADGDVDLVAAIYGADSVVLYENDGGQQFTESVIDSGLDGASSCWGVDIDGDGALDVLASGYGADQVVWYNTSDPTDGGTPIVIASGLDGARWTAPADLDADGDMDVAVAVEKANAVIWLENTGSNGNFTVHSVSNSTAAVLSVVVADVDGDSLMDIVCASQDDDRVQWFRNDGAKDFSEAFLVTSAASQPQSVDAADINGDSLIDILVASKGDEVVAWYEQQSLSSSSCSSCSSSASSSELPSSSPSTSSSSASSSSSCSYSSSSSSSSSPSSSSSASSPSSGKAKEHFSAPARVHIVISTIWFSDVWLPPFLSQYV